ncbi:MAG: nitrogen fixation protein NifW [Alphaproteobacteria bacterium]|nr:nitrogen fixation protein NifW [Alphaproteobacteria bacterium]
MCDMTIELKDLSTAEDFFQELDVPFEPSRLNVARLHILKEFHNRMNAAELAGEKMNRPLARRLLADSYEKFTGIDPRQAKLFKVFEGSGCGSGLQGSGRGFVGLDQIAVRKA